MYEVQVLRGLAEVTAAEWDTLVGADSPFLEWGWLASLEDSACVARRTGWLPQHLIVRDPSGRVIAACPLYLKGHSMGEFVFDHEWAAAAQRAGIEYYPKLLVAVPFTPAAGSRFLTAPGNDRPALIRALGGALREICDRNDFSSVHVNFCQPDEVVALREVGFVERIGFQYQWRNVGYRSFDDYLDHFRSKRRNQIKRERRALDEQGVTIDVRVGDAIPDQWFAPMFDFYKSTIDKLYWGRQYLHPEFFERLRARFKRNLCFVVAHQDGAPIAGTFNVQKGGVFYGRYWGATRELRHLHFNVCYYAAIAHCIEHGLQRFEPGAGGEFKTLRGFDPQRTFSMHYIRDPRLAAAIERFLLAERCEVDRVVEWMHERSELKGQ
ncbi:MAG TPA: GNAT family N-acetyltransferase [Candidatus Kryptonia bacterium]|nr:GNAT family N-acetyltransferase [Candidatus Kryptonia bacterium]